MQRGSVGHALDGFHLVPLAGKAEDQAREYGNSIEKHRARSALAQLAAVLRAGQAQVFAQHLEEGFVGREGDVRGISVDNDLYLTLRVRIALRQRRTPPFSP